VIKPLFDWIPPGRLLGIDYLNSQFLVLCACLLIPIALCAWKRWARLVDAPWVFAFVYGVPFFALNFADSLGDTLQVMDYIFQRYYMSEPGATALHYWLNRLLREPFDLTPKVVIGLSSSIAGVVYLWLTAKISCVLLSEADARRRLLFRLVYFAAGSSLMFYGYVENPPLAMPGEQAWVLATILFLRNPSARNNVACGVALAVATVIHGRAAFLAPALLVGCLLPAAPWKHRLWSATIGCSAFVATIAVVIGGIFLFDRAGIMGNGVGNITGGGNRRMFVDVSRFLSAGHWAELSSILWVAAGVTAPAMLLSLSRVARAPRPLYLLWGLSYVISGVLYVSIWEFDYGFFLDWDLLFSGAGGFTFLSALGLASSRIPVLVSLPFVGAELIVSMAFAAVVNGGPLGLRFPPSPTYPDPQPVCAPGGLRREYFRDSQLSDLIGVAGTSPANGEWSTASPTHPNLGKPLGVRYSGFVYISKPGRYRFYLQSGGNLRFLVSGITLYERWTGFEWQIFSEREVYFSQPGWYPLQADLYSRLEELKFKIELESATTPRHLLTVDELCS
jgi:hypothetical protein